ncbi:MAG: hypothetical protein K2W88_14915 [Pararheinheimera sp.]|nr:hypothetical protein [Rheinheimera sp.]
MVYLKQFIDAIAFLSEFEPEHSISDAKRNEIYKYFKNKSSDLELQKAISEAIDQTVPEFIKNLPYPAAHQCNALSHSFHRVWKNSPLNDVSFTAITIGTVEYRGKKIYDVDKISIKKMIKDGPKIEQQLNAHVWLTLSDLTVLDLTISPTLVDRGYVKSGTLPDYIIWREDRASDFRYTPILQHNNFIDAVDIIRGIL